MSALPLTDATILLADRAADLSLELHRLQERCAHTSTDVGSVAGELAHLAEALGHLHQVMCEDPNRYTESFNQDLTEIVNALRAIFQETFVCCAELQKADPAPGNTANWLIKKSKVHSLQKRVETLRTTLVVMRTVLQRGQEYTFQK